MDKTRVRTIIFKWSPCSEEWSWSNNQQHTTIWRCSYLLNEWHTLRVWCNCRKYTAVSSCRIFRHCLFSPGGYRRISTAWGYLDLKELNRNYRYNGFCFFSFIESEFVGYHLNNIFIWLFVQQFLQYELVVESPRDWFWKYLTGEFRSLSNKSYTIDGWHCPKNIFLGTH